jgi:predicted extracellular nuclease
MSLVITGIIDGPLPGGLPKAVELTATADIADLSVYALESASNGNPSTGPEFVLPAGSLAAGAAYYVATEETGFAEFFGFAPDATSGVLSVNGDDAVILYEAGIAIDAVGAVGTDGTGEPWEYLDGWAYRNAGTAASTAFDPADWTFSGPDALDGATSNATAGTPFPAGAFIAGPPPAAAILISEIDSDTPSTDAAEFVELSDGGIGNTALDGLTLVLFNGSNDEAYDVIALDGFSTNADGFFVVGSATVPEVDLAAFTTNGLQNGADAVALYSGPAPALGQAPTTENLVDAVVYGTADPPDEALLAALGLTVQQDEAAGGDSAANSLQRLDDGTFATGLPTPGTGVVTPPPPPPPPAEITLISGIQGVAPTGPLPVVGVDDVSPLLGQTVTIRAVVTADFQDGAAGGTGDLNGFYVQEEVSDYDMSDLTSEGIFVFDGANPAVDVAVGDLVEVTGTVGEFFGETQISAMTVAAVESGVPLPAAVTATLGGSDVMLDDDGGYVVDLEAREGMLVTVDEPLTITELFNLDRFGEYRVATERPAQFTQDNAPDVAAFDAFQREIASESLVLDDGLSVQNPDPIRIIDGNDGILTAADSFRMGDQITDLTGVLAYRFDEFRIQNGTGDFVQQNPRPDAPEALAGGFTVASVNVLNFFTTLDDGGNTDIGAEPRGADNQAEFDRQLVKLVDAIVTMDADVLGLVEIENDFAGPDFAVKTLVEELNDATAPGTYDFVDPGQQFVGGDAIANAFIYQPGSVNLVGDAAILTEFEGRDFIDPLDAGRGLNRAAVAQTFEDASSGETLTVAVNHLKSKGSLSGLPEDEAQGDGQGRNNATRTEAADILADWLASDPTGQGAERKLIVGDLNSYANEDPITLLEAAGYTDLAELSDSDGYSYVFDGQVGTLDYALANDALLADFAGATEWNVNADEADALDYNLDFGRSPDLFTADARRFSDHDPVIVSFDFEGEPTAPNLVAGTPGDDTLIGSDGPDLIEGLGGSDLVFAKAGDDEVRGDGGGDRLFAGAGDDTLVGGDGDDMLVGEAGDDVLLGGRNRDELIGGAGDDLLDGGFGGDLSFGGAGADTFRFSAEAASNNLVNRLKVLDYDAMEGDLIDLDGAGIDRVIVRNNSIDLRLAGDGDIVEVQGARSFEEIVFVTDEFFPS